MGDDARRSFLQAVEAARLGYLTARDRKALHRWRTHRAKLEAGSGRAAAPGVTGSDGGGLTGRELERALYAMAATHSDIVAIRRPH